MRLASRGLRDMDGGEEPIVDPDELGRVRSQAARVWAKTFLLAAVLTAALFILPR